ncbi:hypothetical protein J6590_047075 [Homalodisca vitripennis]|nr:hypothetical protein J6590_047075 [Homalodisca vitripennis]
MSSRNDLKSLHHLTFFVTDYFGLKAPKDWGASRFYKPDDPRYWCPPEPGWDQRSVGLDTTNSKQLKLSSYWMIKESRGGLDVSWA